MAHVAEAPQKSVGPGFKPGRWSLFPCRHPSEQCILESLQHIAETMHEVKLSHLRKHKNSSKITSVMYNIIIIIKSNALLFLITKTTLYSVQLFDMSLWKKMER